MLSLLQAFMLAGQASEEDLTLRFLTTDSDGAIHIATNYKDYSTIGIFLTENEKFDELEICNDDQFNIWMNNRLRFDNKSCFRISKDSLFLLAGKDSLFLVLNTKGDFRSVIAKAKSENFTLSAFDNLITPKWQAAEGDLMILMLLTNIILFGILRRGYPRLYKELFNGPYLGIQTQFRQTQIEPLKIFLTLFVSVLAGSCIWYVRDYSSPTHVFDFYPDLFAWFRYILLVVIFVGLKYVFIQIVSGLNSFKILPEFQIYDFLRISALFMLVLFVFINVEYWVGHAIIEERGLAWGHYFTVANTVFLLYFFYQSAFSLKYSKLHIFSYLCTTEILGAVLIAIIFTK